MHFGVTPITKLLHFWSPAEQPILRIAVLGYHRDREHYRVTTRPRLGDRGTATRKFAIKLSLFWSRGRGFFFLTSTATVTATTTLSKTALIMKKCNLDCYGVVYCTVKINCFNCVKSVTSNGRLCKVQRQTTFIL